MVITHFYSEPPRLGGGRGLLPAHQTGPLPPLAQGEGVAAGQDGELQHPRGQELREPPRERRHRQAAVLLPRARGQGAVPPRQVDK